MAAHSVVNTNMPLHFIRNEREPIERKIKQMHAQSFHFQIGLFSASGVNRGNFVMYTINK